MSTQTVTVKIHDAKKVISTFQVTKTHDQPVIIQAKANLNYELVDDMTQFAPENIKIQRVGQDLHIAFEDADGLPNDPDLIITNYYQANGGSSNLLIGLSENGSYYAYVPESGLQEGAVSMLADQITSAQALGGEALVPAAFAFNPWWLLGLSPLAAAGGGGGGGGGDTTAPTVTSIVMSDTQLKSGETSIVTITFSEAVTGFDNTDVMVENGTLSTLISNDGGITWTGIFTPTADIEDTINIITVANTYTDAAGNGGTGAISENYEIDTKPPTAILMIDPITEDNIVNASEAGGMVTVTGSVSGAYDIADQVSLIINNKTYLATIGSGGTWSVAVAGSDLVADDDTQVDGSVKVYDIAGNDYTASASQDYTVDTIYPSATLIIDPITEDNIVNASEAGGMVTVTGSVSGAYDIADQVSLIINNKTYLATIGSGGTWSVAVAGSDLVADDDTQVDGSVKVYDIAGNDYTASASQDYTVDTIYPSATLIIDPITEDNIVNASEAGGMVTVTGSVSGAYDIADQVSLIINNKTYLATIGSGGTWSVAVAGSDLVADDDTQVDGSVKVYDIAGNDYTASASQDYTVDTIYPSATLIIDPITEDNIVNASEAGGMVTVTGSVSGAYDIADQVSLIINNKTYLATIGSGGTWSVAVAGSDLVADDDTQVDGSVKVYDIAGNDYTASASQDYTVDTIYPSATLIIDPITEDNIVNASEAGGMVTVTGSVSGAYDIADQVSLIINNKTYLATIGSGGTWSVAVAGSDLVADDDTQVDGSVKVYDIAGNDYTASASQDYTVDTIYPSATLIIDPITEDNIVNASEAGGMVTVTGSVSGAYDIADQVSLIINNKTYLATIGSGGTWSVAVAGSDLVADDDTQVDGSVKVYDIAGNDYTASASQDYTVDTIYPSATLIIDPITEDNIVNASEAGGMVTVTGSVSGAYDIADQVSLIINNKTYLATIGSGGTWSVAVAGSDLVADDDTQVDGSVKVYDIAGNDYTASASQDYTVDTIYPSATLIIDPITEDNIVNASEAGGMVTVTGSVSGAYDIADQVSLIINNKTYLATIGSGGTWSVAVAGSDLVADDDTQVDGSVKVYDIAGNDYTASASQDYTVDTIYPSATLIIDPITEDNIVNASEAGGMVTVTGSVSGAYDIADQVSLIINNKTYLATIGSGGTWSVSVR